MLLKGIFYKLVFVLVLLLGWVTYSRRDEIVYSLGKARHDTVKTVKNFVPGERAAKVTTYEWIGPDGIVHLSNIKPEQVNGVKTRRLTTDQNIVGSVSRYDAPRRKSEKTATDGFVAGLPNQIAEGVKVLQYMKNDQIGAGR